MHCEEVFKPQRGGHQPQRENHQPQTRRNFRNNKNITGTRESSASEFQGVPRIFDVFVGGCLLNSTAEQLDAYCKEGNLTLKKCEPLQTKSEWYKSYKISVDSSRRDDVLSKDFWPKGIFVRKFYRARTGIINNES